MISPLVQAQLAPNFNGHTISLLDNNNTLLVDGKPISLIGIGIPAEFEQFQLVGTARQAQIIALIGAEITAIIGGTIVETVVGTDNFDTSEVAGDATLTGDGDVDVPVDDVQQDSGSAVVDAEEASAEGQPEN